MVETAFCNLGDFVTITGAANAANNVTLKKINSITTLKTGFAIKLEGVSFVTEVDSSAVCSFRSKYDVFPIGAGLGLTAAEVDIQQHEDIRDNFLSSDVYDFYLKDTINVKDFLSAQVYNPVGCFSLPRKARASVGIHRPPLPGVDIKILDSTNVLNANKLKLERSINKDFFNSVIYKYEELVLENKFTKGFVTTNATSLSQIPIGNRPLTIEAKGFREILSADLIAADATSRRLNKYKFGAERINGIDLNLKDGFSIEIGDAVIVDIASLQITDTKTGTRAGKERMFDVVNKKINTKTGIVTIDVSDTAVDTTLRFGLITPSSFISTGISTTQFIIKPSFNTDRFGLDEFKKWNKLEGVSVIVRSQDYSVSDTSTISSISGNTFTLSSALSFVPQTDYVVELDQYDNQNDRAKLLYGFMSDAVFADGGNQYVML